MEAVIYVEIHTLRDSLKFRRSEWGLAAVMALGWGVLLWADPAPTFANPSFSTFYRWGTEIQWGVGCTLLGFARLLVLYVNGRWRRCSHARMLLAGLSCFVWATITLNLIFSETGTPGQIVYLIFLMMDFHTIYEAGRDARIVDERTRARSVT